MRECDHQAVQQGFMVKVVKKEGFDHPIPEVIATYPGERTTPRLQEDHATTTDHCDPRRACAEAPLRAVGSGEGLSASHPTYPGIRAPTGSP